MAAGRLEGRGVLVTGAGRGIGRALAHRAAAEGARVVVNDLDPALAAEVAEEVGGHAEPGDCATDAGARRLVGAAREHLDRLDVLMANAGVDVGGGLDTPDEVWEQALEVNVMAHVRLARAVVPTWLDTPGGTGGRFVVTASAAGLLGMIGNAPYTVTKHGAVAFAEWLSMTYGDRGVTVQAICPQGVRTRMLEHAGPLTALLSRDGALTPEQVADAWVSSLDDDRFLVLPHPEVADYYSSRAADTDGWLRGMRRLRTRVEAAAR
ncbi:SDR family oxidoreductase [Nocardioides lentus]|uniref:SDR family oxidoreductase n=1 Tax=Nocardioides lentus TaxID=338077 RepID=A0ABN2PRZ9_9ACTN